MKDAKKRPTSLITWEERVKDHNAKIEEYLENCLFRGCSPETTIKSIRSVLTRMFSRVEIDDPSHVDGHRHLLFWELLEPQVGPSRVSLIVRSLLAADLAPGSRRSYMNDLRSFCDYVLLRPNIPGSEVTVANKYGPIAPTFTKYDVPIHAQDRPLKSRYALTAGLRDDFYEFLRTTYLPNHPLPHVAARNYTAIVLQAETGARISELLAIRSGGGSSDIDSVNGRVRLFGKAKAYSGKRIRWVPLTPLATEVLNVFKSVFRPMFSSSFESTYLFLSKDGMRLKNFQYQSAFRKIIEMARQCGLRVPEDLRTHDLRRTFATIELERNPLAYRKLLKKLGHSYPSSIAPYIVVADDDVEEEQGDLIDMFVDPHIEKRGGKRCQ